MRGEGQDLFTKESPLPLPPEGALLQPVISTKIDKSISSRFMPALYHRGMSWQGEEDSLRAYQDVIKID